MMFDTDILIWVFRGNAKAARLIDSETDRRISIVTYIELLQGARNQKEMKGIKTFISDLAFEVVPITENTGYRASIYMEEYGLKTAICLAVLPPVENSRKMAGI